MSKTPDKPKPGHHGMNPKLEVIMRAEHGEHEGCPVWIILGANPLGETGVWLAKRNPDAPPPKAILPALYRHCEVEGRAS